MQVTIELEVPEGYRVLGHRQVQVNEMYLSQGIAYEWEGPGQLEGRYFILEAVPWRAEHGKRYWFLSAWEGALECEDWRTDSDDKLWEQGNYFKSQTKACLMHKEVLKLYKENV